MSQNKTSQSHNQEQLDQLRHSFAHLLGAAVLELFPGANLTIGPAIENGFYYDVALPDGQKISEADLPKLEKKMKQLAKSWKEFKREEVTKAEALKRYADNPYKQELINEFAEEGKTLSFYQAGEFSDLCRGGHVDQPSKELKHFKLLSVAGAYWRGDENNTMLTRVYGTAFPSAEELKAHLEMLEEAKKRDHRKLGQELELFFIDEMVGKGLIMWLPKGNIVKEEVEGLARELEAAQGYQRVATPHIAKQELFETSGHLPYYQDSMYPGMEMDDGTYFLKAMNCPHHHRMYGHQPRSYRDLPMRLAEYGTVYRNELSGTLAGLLRVRGLCMNDAHIYCTKDQIKDEFKAVMELTQAYFDIFGLENYWFRLSKWDPAHTDKYINQPDNWQFAEQVLREVLQEMKVPFEEADDEAAFYGPKVDVQFKSVIGREETMSTIQLDFMAKDRFGLEYIDDNGQKNNQVFVIHRAPLSTHERFMAFLIEHYAGAFPAWLAPIQAKVLPIADRHADFGAQVVEQLKAAGLRAELDDRSETLGNKIRQAQGQKIPYMLVVGDQEVEAGSVAVRKRSGKKQDVMSVKDFVGLAKKVVEERSLEE